MKNQLSNATYNIYSLLFTPKLFFENKKPDSLRAALPYLLVGIVITEIIAPFHSHPIQYTFISIYQNASFFFLKVTLMYIIIRLLGEKTPYINILATMMFVSVFSIFYLIYYKIFVLSNILFEIDFVMYLYGLPIIRTLLFIWTSYCAIIGLSTMQKIDRKNATIGVLVVFSFFYLRSLFYDISTILAFL